MADRIILEPLFAGNRPVYQVASWVKKMTVLNTINPDPAKRKWLRKELLRRAAVDFEKAGAFVEAAECWDDYGDPNRSRRCLLWLKPAP